ncbi:MAG: helix-turn-helix domain-containing protein [Clostridia bacterium]|nr:helix-turn-helix domain-containing protein [Clostridia bacterium]
MNIIRELRKQKGMSQNELAQRCNVHQTAVSQWENGRTSPDNESLKILAGVLGVSVGTLIGGEDIGSTVLVPVLGYVRAGIPMEAVEDILDYEEISAEMASRGEYFGLKIKGDSMFPLFQAGDTVIVRRQPDAESGEIAVVLVNGNDATVKKIIKKDTSLLLVSENSAYEPMVFSKSEIENLPVTIIGKVVELRRKFGF